MTIIPVRHIKTAQKEPVLSGNFSIRSIELMLEGADLIQELHRHDFFLVLVLANGSGNHTIDFIPYTVSDHSVCFMRPGQVHELVLKAGSRGYLLQYNTDFYKAGIHSGYCQLEEVEFQKLMNSLAAVITEYSDQRENYEQAIRANLDIFFIELARQRPTRPVSPESRYKQERLDQFMSLLEQHIFTQKKVSQYAELLNLSAYQLNAITKDLLGKTTSTLINEQIVLEAKRCLLATSYQVNQISYHMGFEDPSYFIRFFKKQTGQSPDTFRHIYR